MSGYQLGAFEDTINTINDDKKRANQLAVAIPKIPIWRSPAHVNYETNCVEFTLNMMASAARSSPKSTFIISPSAVQVTFGMCLLGSESLTKFELKENIFPRVITVDSYLKKLTKTVADAETFRAVIRLFATDSAEFNVSYKKKLTSVMAKTDHYWSISEIDFKNADPKEMAAYINQQIDKKLDEFETVPNTTYLDGIINADIRLLIAQAFCFKAKWFNPFLLSKSCKGQFYRSAECPGIPVEYMQQKGTFSYAENERWRILKKATFVKSVTVYFLLPQQRTNIEPNDFNVHPVDLVRLLKQCSLQPVTVALPKFQIQQPWDEITKAMQQLGLKDSFKPMRANFCHMATVWDIDRGFSISNAVQKFHVQMDEGTTEPEDEPPDQEIGYYDGFAVDDEIPNAGDSQFQFIADHPFLFFLIAEESTILFVLLAGRYPGPQG